MTDSSNSNYHAIRQLKADTTFGKGDILVLFGELFSRGYANGLVEEAERRGMTIVRTTVGRREKDGTLRKLNAEEITNIPSPFINVPLEAGFDMEPDDNGISPIEHIKDVKLSDWKQANIKLESIESSKKKGRIRFQKNIQEYLQQLETHLPAGKNVLFAHLMAGGVPRAKIIMPMMNRSLKGTGDRFMSSEDFWQSNLGRLCEHNFNEVTAETFSTLIQESTNLREKLQKTGSKISYVAFGYHGTEVLIDGKYQWQTYSPYLQGWAKKKLEDYSRELSKVGIKTAVYNCPEILTNSSSIFSGVEISLYPLLGALKKEGPSSEKSKQVIENCLKLLKPEFTLEKVMEMTSQFLSSEVIRSHCQFEKWPQHNSNLQLEKMLAASDGLLEMHLDTKQLMTFVLSEVVFDACGQIMLADAPHPEAPASWINHDVIAKIYSK